MGFKEAREIAEYNKKLRKLALGDMFVKKSDNKDGVNLPIILLEFDMSTSMCIVAKYYADLPVITIMPIFILITEYDKASNKQFTSQILRNVEEIDDEALSKDELFMGLRCMYLSVAYGEEEYGNFKNYEEFKRMKEEAEKAFEKMMEEEE